MRISQLVSSIEPSPTLAISGRAKELVAQGIDVVSFSAGEPDFTTPTPILDAADQAMRAGRTHYTAVGGAPELKAAIRSYYERRTGLSYADSEIVASCGAKHTLYNLFLTILDPGDEVIIPAPYWVSYPAQVKICGATPVIVAGEAANGFVPTLQALEAATTDKTRAFVFNNPTNPTGAFWDKESLQALAEWLKRNPQIIVVSDAIYDELIYDGLEATELLTLAPELRDRYVIVNGVSKAFAMTGWRLGYALAPAAIVKGIQTLQSQSTSNPCSVTQFATIEALNRSDEMIAPGREKFEKRRDLIFDLLGAIDGVELVKPRGAFYAFPDVSSFFGKSFGDRLINDDFELAAYLLDEARVAVVPGGAFGAPGFVRMSYASKEETIREGVRRMAEALAALS